MINCVHLCWPRWLRSVCGPEDLQQGPQDHAGHRRLERGIEAVQPAGRGPSTAQDFHQVNLWALPIASTFVSSSNRIKICELFQSHPVSQTEYFHTVNSWALPIAIKFVRASNRIKIGELFQSHQNLLALPIATCQPDRILTSGKFVSSSNRIMSARRNTFIS